MPVLHTWWAVVLADVAQVKISWFVVARGTKKSPSLPALVALRATRSFQPASQSLPAACGGRNLQQHQSVAKPTGSSEGLPVSFFHRPRLLITASAQQERQVA